MSYSFSRISQKFFIALALTLSLSSPLSARPPAGRLPEPTPTVSLRASEMQNIMDSEEDLIDQRTRAEEMLNKNSNDFRAHMLLGFVLHRAEGDLARSRYHLEKAKVLALKDARKTKSSDSANFYQLASFELVMVLTEMDEYQAKIDLCEELYSLTSNELWLSEMGWPYMKLHQEQKAREAIQQALHSSRIQARINAWNSLGALESSVGNYQAAYDAFDGLNKEMERYGNINMTFCRNLGEAALPLGRYDVAEKYYSKAASLPFTSTSFSNPHQDLTRFYLNQARFSEAINSMKKTLEWSRAMKPFLYQQSMADNTQLHGMVALELGLPTEAVEILKVLVQRPDRRGATSVHIDQAEASNLLCWRMALRTNLERNRERMASTGFWRGLWAMGKYAWQWVTNKKDGISGDSLFVSLLFDNWHMRRQIDQAGKRIAALAADNGRIRHSMLPYDTQSIDTVEWYRPALVGMWGTGLSKAALDSLPANPPENMSFSEPFVSVLRGEIAYLDGDYKDCIKYLNQALVNLPRQEALLTYRTETRLAMAFMKRGDYEQAVKLYSDVLTRDSAMIREVGAQLPVKVNIDSALASTSLGSAIRTGLKRSPRFKQVDGCFILNISQRNQNTLGVNLTDNSNNSLKSFTVPLDDTQAPLEDTALIGIHDGLCAPNVSISGLTDTLDGSNYSNNVRELIKYK